MWLKALNALLTVGIGLVAAVFLYYLLNKIAELLPGKVEDKLKPWLYILPAYVAITVYLIYPSVLAFIASFQDATSENWVGFENFRRLLTNSGFHQTLFNTLLWMIIVPVVTVILGLAVAVLADRLKPRRPCGGSSTPTGPRARTRSGCRTPSSPGSAPTRCRGSSRASSTSTACC
jgi:alpha-glucoside transport system permease protein